MVIHVAAKSRRRCTVSVSCNWLQVYILAFGETGERKDNELCDVPISGVIKLSVHPVCAKSRHYFPVNSIKLVIAAFACENAQVLVRITS